MKLEPELAQTIVNKMMNQIPYNINMMDEFGYIIASGNPERLNTLHIGAQMAIKERKALLMEQEYGVHGMPGINMPVFFDSEIVGVIGITGNPSEVQPLASLLRTATELLLNQSETDRNKREFENRRHNFIVQWTHATNIAFNEDLITTGTQLNIDVLKNRTAIAVNNFSQHKLRTDTTDITVPISNSTQIVLTQFPQNLKSITNFCNTHQLFFGIGESTIQVTDSITHALQTMKINQLIGVNKYTHYQQVQFIYEVLQSKSLTDQLQTQFQSVILNQNNRELLATVVSYVINNQSIDITSKELHIHRNTLNYRFAKIKDLTNLDPHNTLDLFKLFVGYLSTQLRNNKS